MEAHLALDSSSMLDRERLERLRETAAVEDWPLAGEIYIELSLETRGTSDRTRIERLARYVRLRDAAGLFVVVDELLKSDSDEQQGARNI